MGSLESLSYYYTAGANKMITLIPKLQGVSAFSGHKS